MLCLQSHDLYNRRLISRHTNACLFQIHTESPRYNTDDDTVTVYISWRNPVGFIDDDIYGYENPAIYPIHCNSPEAELQSPSVVSSSSSNPSDDAVITAVHATLVSLLPC